jgi:uncharacterized protein YecE (DUF72 family)
VEFGKLENIQAVNWTLPPDDPGNSERIIASPSFKLSVGSPAWGAKQWVGKIYPAKTPTEEYLYHYSRHFNCIELNTTHYRIPDDKTTNDWLSKVPASFLFCPKVFKEISHSKTGMVDKILLSHWFNFLGRIEKNLGPCFIQFHEMFSYSDKRLLFLFLENWPSEFKLCLELRHPSWFQNGIVLPALSNYLAQRKIGLVITDVAGRRDVLHSSLSTDYSMIRLIGNNLDPSDGKRLTYWARRLQEWKDLGLKDTYLFLHQPDDVLTIEFSQLAHDIFTKEGFTEFPSFTMNETQEDLLSFMK